MPQLPAPDYPDDVRARLEADARRSSPATRDRGRRSCRCCTSCSRRRATSARTASRSARDMLDLTTAEVAAVATFYTHVQAPAPTATTTVGVCTNTLCAVMGGDAIFDDAQGPPRRRPRRDDRRRQGHPRAPRVQRGLRLRAGRDGQLGVLRQPDARVSARQLVDDLRAGRAVVPTRGAASVHVQGDRPACWPGFPDERAGPSRASGVRGRRRWRASPGPRGEAAPARGSTASATAGRTTSRGTGPSTSRRRGRAPRVARRAAGRRRPPTPPTRPGPPPRRGSDDLGTRARSEAAERRETAARTPCCRPSGTRTGPGRLDVYEGTRATRACARRSRMSPDDLIAWSRTPVCAAAAARDSRRDEMAVHARRATESRTISLSTPTSRSPAPARTSRSCSPTRTPHRGHVIACYAIGRPRLHLPAR